MRKPYEVFGALWLLFRWLVNDMVEDDRWRQSFFIESSKPRIMYRDSTRKRLLERLLSMDARCATKALHYDWSEDLFDGRGIFEGVKRGVG